MGNSFPLKKASGQGRVVKAIDCHTSKPAICKLVVVSLVSLLIILNINMPAAAQAAIDLRGTVSDERGAVIVGASIALQDGRGHEYNTRTDKQGQYQIVAASPGTFALTVAASGFLEVT